MVRFWKRSVCWVKVVRMALDSTLILTCLVETPVGVDGVWLMTICDKRWVWSDCTWKRLGGSMLSPMIALFISHVKPNISIVLFQFSSTQLHSTPFIHIIFYFMSQAYITYFTPNHVYFSSRQPKQSMPNRVAHKGITKFMVLTKPPK